MFMKNKLFNIFISSNYFLTFIKIKSYFYLNQFILINFIYYFSLKDLDIKPLASHYFWNNHKFSHKFTHNYYFDRSY